MKFIADGKRLATTDMVAEMLKSVNPEISKVVNNAFDLNQNFKGFVSTVKKIPVHAPNGINTYAFYLSFGTRPNYIQLAFDINEKIFIRAYSGKTGAMAWDDWKQIGGVKHSANPLITRLYTTSVKAVA